MSLTREQVVILLRDLADQIAAGSEAFGDECSVSLNRQTMGDKWRGELRLTWDTSPPTDQGPPWLRPAES